MGLQTQLQKLGTFTPQINYASLAINLRRESPGSISNQEAARLCMLELWMFCTGRRFCSSTHVGFLSLWECEHTFEENALTWNTANQEHPRGASQVVSVICVHLIQHSLCFHGTGIDSSSSTSLRRNHFCSNTDTFLCVTLKSCCLYLNKIRRRDSHHGKQLSLYPLTH